MDVCCPRCDTLYELDDRQLDEGAATLKCSQCGHLFRLQRQSGVQSERQRRWMIRQSSTGEYLYFTGFDTLHEWIMDGTVSADDAISRTGNSWTLIGDIGEFTPIFQVVESIANLSGQSRDSAGESSTSPAQERQPQPTPSKPSHDNQTTAPGQTTPTEDRQPSSTPAKSSSAEQPDPPVDRSATPEKPQQDPRRSSTDAAGVEGDQTESGPPSRPEVKLEQRRFQNPDPQDATSAGGDGGEGTGQDTGELTLGQLERPDQKEPPAGAVTTRRRRWPLVVVILVGAVGVGIWQYDEVERIATDLSEQWLQSGEQPPVESPEEFTDSAAVRAVDSIADAVEEARHRDHRARMQRGIERGTSHVVAAVEQAGQAGASARRDRAPTLADPVAAGRRALNRGDADAALTQFERALEMSPDNAEAMVGLGWALLTDGESREALGYFEQARRLDSSLGDALIGIGRAGRNLGQYETALEAYEDYLAEFPDGDQRSIAEFQSQQLRQQLEE